MNASESSISFVLLLIISSDVAALFSAIYGVVLSLYLDILRHEQRGTFLHHTVTLFTSTALLFSLISQFPSGVWTRVAISQTSQLSVQIWPKSDSTSDSY
jgi:D-alanyl-lipoteichoic acid acyltransferase DltB (MBOAT superfamily)